MGCCIATGFALIILFASALQASVVAADHEGTPHLPNDYRFWYHVGSKSISADAASAIGLPAEVFGNTFDSVFANVVALNDMRSGAKTFRDGAEFVAAVLQAEQSGRGTGSTRRSGLCRGDGERQPESTPTRADGASRSLRPINPKSPRSNQAALAATRARRTAISSFQRSMTGRSRPYPPPTTAYSCRRTTRTSCSGAAPA